MRNPASVIVMERGILRIWKNGKSHTKVAELLFLDSARKMSSCRDEGDMRMASS